MPLGQPILGALYFLESSMNNFILPAILTHSLLIRLAFIFPFLQWPIGCLLLAELAVMALLAARSNQFDGQGQIYFGLLILAMISAVVFGV
jgi:hypothetical protein